MHDFLQRFDHANIFVLIAGSCTPFALLLLDGAERWTMLAVTVWGGALLGVAVPGASGAARRAGSTPRSTSRSAGRAVFFFGDFVTGARARRAIGTAVLVLVIVGGGALHARRGSSTASSGPTRRRAGSASTRCSTRFTILAFVSHYVGVSLATYSLR